MSRIGVVFVSYRSSALVATRAAELSAAGLRVVVADNAGDVGPIAGVTVFETGGNIGFGAACNRAVGRLDPDVMAVCFHNPDAEAKPEVVCELATRARQLGGIVAPAVRTRGRIRAAGYRYPSLLREAWLAGRPGRPARTRATTARQLRRGSRRRFGTAALVAVDRDAFTEVGGFDEDYFLYAEDLDLWHRMRRASRPCVFAPDLLVDHVGAAGASLDAGSRELLRWLGVERFAEKFARAGWRPYRLIHRHHLTRLDASTELVGVVDAAWRSDAPPVAVLADVRAAIESRSFTVDERLA